MTPLEQIPINSLSWVFGTVALLAIGIKSLAAYRNSHSPLTKYICWFSLLITISLAFFGFPSLFTLDVDTLHKTYIAGEVFMYAALVAQGAILWFLMLRRFTSVYTITIPVGLLGLATWLYAAPRSVLYLDGNFIGYREPLICNYSLAFLFVGLFAPVGWHFLRATMRQSGFKNRLVTFMIGLVYMALGISMALHLVIAHNVSTPIASVGNLIFFVFLIVATAWPRREKSQSVLTEVHKTAKV